MRTRALTIVCVLAAAGCNDTLDEQGLIASVGQFGVMADNYKGATTISLLDDMGRVSKNEWVGSKTKDAKLRTPLSQDVVLPTVANDGNHLTTIERGLGVVTRFDLGTGSVLGQLRTDESPEDDTAAYHSNPQDVTYISDESAWVTRARQNPDGGAKESERGNDLIEWNPTTFKRTGRRIDMSDLNEEIDEMQLDENGMPAGTAKATAYAAPGMIVPLIDYAAVGLTGITLNYNFGPGKLAIVDLKKGKRVSVLELEGLTNCLEVKLVPGDGRSVIVTCVGAFGDTGEHAGVLKVGIDDDGNASITRRYLKSDRPEDARITGNVASLGGDIVVAVAAGHIDPMSMEADVTDRLMRIDLASGKHAQLLQGKHAFTLGSPAFSVNSGLLLYPDAGDKDNEGSCVHRFLTTVARDVKYIDCVKVAPDTELAPRQVLAL